jgi:hypothetical protein
LIGRLELERAGRAGHASAIGGRSLCRRARAGAARFGRRAAVRRGDGAKNGSHLAVKASQPPGRSQQGPCRLFESACRLSGVGCGLPLADCAASMLRPFFSPCATNRDDGCGCASASLFQRRHRSRTRSTTVGSRDQGASAVTEGAEPGVQSASLNAGVVGAPVESSGRALTTWRSVCT